MVCFGNMTSVTHLNTPGCSLLKLSPFLAILTKITNLTENVDKASCKSQKSDLRPKNNFFALKYLDLIISTQVTIVTTHVFTKRLGDRNISNARTINYPTMT